MKTENRHVELPLLDQYAIELVIKREDEIHTFISGNKYRKLKYNLLEAKRLKFNTLLTFGGAYSNHIAATAYLGKAENLKTIGVIRGEELKTKWQDNPTLRLAASQGMQFHFVDRETYRNKTYPHFIAFLKNKFGAFYTIPEGGTNALAVKGCQEILTHSDDAFEVICSSVGTGGTLAGLINSSKTHQKVLGFAALKGDFLNQDIRKFATKTNWELINDFHFGGYAKVNKELVLFLNRFKKETGIPLDPVYTGKMVYGILELVKSGRFEKGTKILAIHTGGLQGITGMNTQLKKKNLPLIDL